MGDVPLLKLLGTSSYSVSRVCHRKRGIEDKKEENYDFDGWMEIIEDE